MAPLIKELHPKHIFTSFSNKEVREEKGVNHVKSWLIGKDSDAGRDWGQEEKGMIEDEMAGWHHRLYGREFEWTPGVGDGQGGLVCCDSWGCKESDTTERLNWTEPQFKGISSLVLCLLYGPALTTIHDYWIDHILDYTDLCWKSNVFTFNTLTMFVIDL